MWQKLKDKVFLKRHEEKIANRKKMGFKRFLMSFKYSFDGIKYAYTQEQSLTLHSIITFGAIIMGLWLKIDGKEWIFIAILLGLIISIELLNTAVEAVVDLVTPSYHPLAKIAKDTASAAVFIFSIVAFFSACVVFVPKIVPKIISLFS